MTAQDDCSRMQVGKEGMKRKASSEIPANSDSPQKPVLPRPPSRENLRGDIPKGPSPPKLPQQNELAAARQGLQDRPFRPAARIPKPRRTEEIARYHLPYKGSSLVISKGSVVDFRGPAIVNAANQGCLGGGGVDGAISRAGGPRLERDRFRLPVLEIKNGAEIRCKVGMAVLTGPNDYGNLPPYIIHAVGPNFCRYEDDEMDVGIQLLKEAYGSALDIASESQVGKVGFSLLSAGVFRGPLSLTEVLSHAVEAIRDWFKAIKKRHEEEGIDYVCLKEIHLCAFTRDECYELKDVCDHLLPYQSEK